MTVPSFDVEFHVYCADCGAGLCNQSDTDTRNGRLRLEVSPCKQCMEREAYEAVDKACRQCDKE